MKRDLPFQWRFRIARWIFPPLRALYDVSIPYRASMVLIPEAGEWTEEDCNRLIAIVEREVGRPVTVTALRSRQEFVVHFTERLP